MLGGTNTELYSRPFFGELRYRGVLGAILTQVALVGLDLILQPSPTLSF